MKKFYLVLLIVLSFFGFSERVEADDEIPVVGSCDELKAQGKFDDLETLFFDSSSYSTRCFYTLDVSTNNNRNPNEKKCIILKVAFNLDGEYKTSYHNINSYGAQHIYNIKNFILFEIISSVDEKYFRDRVGACPKNMYYKEATKGGQVNMTKDTFYYGLNKGTKMEVLEPREAKIDVPQLIVKDPNATGDTCTDILGVEGVKLLKTIKNLVMIMIPILLIVLATVDIVSAIFSGDENKIKKTQGKLIKRVIIAVVIFLAPVMLGFLFDVINMIWPNLNLDFCGIF